MSQRLSIAKKLKHIWFAFFDTRTPFLVKLLVIIGILYGVSPIDLIPDIFPLLGQMDDAGVLIFVLLVFLRATKKIRKEWGKK